MFYLQKAFGTIDNTKQYYLEQSVNLVKQVDIFVESTDKLIKQDVILIETADRLIESADKLIESADKLIKQVNKLVKQTDYSFLLSSRSLSEFCLFSIHSGFN